MLHPQTPPTTGYKVTWKIVSNDCVKSPLDNGRTSDCVIGNPDHLQCCRIGDLFVKSYGPAFSEAEATGDLKQYLWASGYDAVLVSCEPIV